MKFHWFHLMPYPYLPDDFKQKYHSVWVDPPAGGCSTGEGPSGLQRLSRPARICRALRRRHLRQRAPPERLRPDALAQPDGGGAGAANIEGQARGAGNSVALYDPPTRVAEEMAMLDVMSGGRLVAGFPVGTPMDTVYCYSQSGDPARQVSRGRGLIVRAWKERNRSRSTASSPSCATSIHGRCQSAARRCGSRAKSVETWEWCIKNVSSMPISPISATWPASRLSTAIGKRSSGWARVQSVPLRVSAFVGVAENDAENSGKTLRGAGAVFLQPLLHLDPGFVARPATGIRPCAKGSSRCGRRRARCRARTCHGRRLSTAAA